MKKVFPGICLLFACSAAHAADDFVIRDIKIEGLQRIELGTVFNYLPLKVGDTFDDQVGGDAIKALYKTGFFKDVRLEREGNVLIVFVAERAAIASIKFHGNSEIPSEQLTEVLKQIGLTEGRILDRSLLDQVEQELQRQYYSQGKYAVKIETSIKPLVRNRVDVQIDIAEGESAQIREVNIVGNTAYNNLELLKRMQLTEVGLFGGRSNYSKQLLAADLESLKSFYLDRGYINFQITSTQVSLTPDKQDVYITINIKEGERFTVSDVTLSGELILDKEKIQELLKIDKGKYFSRAEVVSSTRNISDALAEKGYAFANVNIIPDIHEDSRTVGLTLFVDPGKRVYVNRVSISGNTKTRDEVIRREVLQQEGAWLSTKSVADSKTKMDRLGFFEEVTVETPPVPGRSDQVDVNYSVAERPTGTLSAGLGYSDTQGALVNFSVTQENFAGTGKRVSVEIDNSEVTKTYSFAYTNPYYTDTGVSRGFRVYSREVDAAEADITNYSTNSYGVSLNYGVPLSETQRLGFGIGYENTELLAGVDVAESISDFIAENGSEYDTYKITANWSRNTRNRAIFADRGGITRAGVEIAAPGGDLEFYKFNISHSQYVPIKDDIPLLISGSYGSGDGYGDTRTLPPFENYFAGGSRSVRGYESSSLGNPATTRDSFDNPIGGTTRIVGNMELIFPNPFAENSKSVRFSLFVDGGWVYADGEKIDLGELRYSTGVSAIWLTPIGAMRFSLANALNEKEGDKTQNFQFTLGSAF